MTGGAAKTGETEAAILHRRAMLLAQRPPDAAAAATLEIIPFTAGGQPYAVPAKGVRQVRRMRTLARVPQAPVQLLGVTRIRSTVVPVFDLGALLDVRSDARTVGEWVVVLCDGDRPDLGIAADSVDGVHEVSRADIVDPPLGSHTNVGTWGVTAEGVTVLDVPALLDLPPLFGHTALDSGTSVVDDGESATQGGHT